MATTLQNQGQRGDTGADEMDKELIAEVLIAIDSEVLDEQSEYEIKETE